MIWQNPWAWTGLFALALPIIIHMLSRGQARIQRFPTLRFLQLSRLLPTRRTRLQDLLLLAIRLCILLAAIAALAQPLLLTADRRRTLDSALVRAIIVDTSASMMRPTPGGASGIMVGQQEAQRLAAEAATSVVLSSATPSLAVPGALAWLRQHSGRDELVMISDFQQGALEQADLARVPQGVGITLLRIGIDSTTAPVDRTTLEGDGAVVAHINLSPTRTDVVWTSSNAGTRSEPLQLAGGREALQAAAARTASHTIAVSLPMATNRPIAIVYPRYEQRARLVQDTKTPGPPWMSDVMARLVEDSLFMTAAEGALVSGDTTHGASVVIARTRRGLPVVSAAEGAVDGKPHLELFLLADAASPTSATLLAAVDRAISWAPPISELDPAGLSDSTLGSWQRPAALEAVIDRQAGGENAASDGRWLWGVALVLLTVEWLLRRRPHRLVVANDQ